MMMMLTTVTWLRPAPNHTNLLDSCLERLPVAVCMSP